MSKSSQRQSEALYIALISEERFYPSPKQDLLFRVLEFRVLLSGFRLDLQRYHTHNNTKKKKKKKKKNNDESINLSRERRR